MGALLVFVLRFLLGDSESWAGGAFAEEAGSTSLLPADPFLKAPALSSPLGPSEVRAEAAMRTVDRLSFLSSFSSLAAIVSEVIMTIRQTDRRRVRGLYVNADKNIRLKYLSCNIHSILLSFPKLLGRYKILYDDQ